MNDEPPDEHDLPPGVTSVERSRAGGDAVLIGTWSAASAGSLAGYLPDLLWAIRDNERKLGAATHCERHLAVDVKALRARDPAATPVPPLPESIDVMWVVWNWISATATEPLVWWTTGDGDRTYNRDWWD